MNGYIEGATTKAAAATKATKAAAATKATKAAAATKATKAAAATKATKATTAAPVIKAAVVTTAARVTSAATTAAPVTTAARVTSAATTAAPVTTTAAPVTTTAAPVTAATTTPNYSKEYTIRTSNYYKSLLLDQNYDSEKQVVAGVAVDCAKKHTGYKDIYGCMVHVFTDPSMSISIVPNSQYANYLLNNTQIAECNNNAKNAGGCLSNLLTSALDSMPEETKTKLKL